MQRYLTLSAAAAAAGFWAFGSIGPAKANLVKNGGFASNSIDGVFGSSFLGGTQSVAIDDWAVSTSYSFVVADGTAISTNFNQSNNGPDPVFGTSIEGLNGSPLGLYTFGQSVSSPTGSGWFVATDGAYGVDANFTQTVTGFTPGKEYTLSYYFASGQQQGVNGAATSWWKVSLDGLSFDSPIMNIPGQSSISNWQQYTGTFTAASTQKVLKFTADGAPSGEMPFALLAGVAITESGVPPQPSVPGPLPAVGVGMTLAWSRKLRRRITVSARGEAGAKA